MLIDLYMWSKTSWKLSRIGIAIVNADYLIVLDMPCIFASGDYFTNNFSTEVVIFLFTLQIEKIVLVYGRVEDLNANLVIS